MLSGLDAGVRERVAALREQGRFFWLDVSLGETSPDDLVGALRVPERVLPALALPAMPPASRSFHADGESVVFALRCYAGSETRTDRGRVPLTAPRVRVLVTGDYLLTVHVRTSPAAVLAPDLPEERSQRYVVYAVLEAMLVTTSEALGEVEQRLDALGLAWTEGAAHVSRRTLRASGSRLARKRRRVSAEQVVRAHGRGDRALRGFETQEDQYFDRLYEQVNRLLASIDAAANGLAMPLDLQLNERAYVVMSWRDFVLRWLPPNGVLRHELRLDGRTDRQPDCLLAAGPRPHRGSGRLLALLVRRFSP